MTASQGNPCVTGESRESRHRALCVIVHPPRVKASLMVFFGTITMSKRTEKKIYTTEEAADYCDHSDEKLSEADSDASDVDSVEEDMFLPGEDIVLDA